MNCDMSGCIGKPSDANRVAARSDVAEAHRAEVLERGEPRIGRRRNHAALDARRNLAAVALHEVVGRDRFRPHAEAVDAVHLAVLSRCR